LPIRAHHLFGVLETGGLDFIGPALFHFTRAKRSVQRNHNVYKFKCFRVW
jgi:hypothetical protein